METRIIVLAEKDFKEKCKKLAKSRGYNLSTLIRVLLINELKEEGIK